MEPLVSAALDYARCHVAEHVTSVADLVRIPSVSAISKHSTDVRRAAIWLRQRLHNMGMEASVVETPRHPAVVARWHSRPTAPTVLIYGHYDVQPAEPLAAWTSPPFSPRIRGERLFGRGASDDKGQLLAHVAALQSYLSTAGELPLNVTCLFEGEEEIGSPHLPLLLRRHRRVLLADAAVCSDMSMPSPEQPALTYGLRGMLSCEVIVRGADHDLHSGSFGGAVANPLLALCTLMASLHDDRGRIAISGIYSRVRRAPLDERARLTRDGPSDTRMLDDAGAIDGWGEAGFTLFERTVLRPSLSLTGVTGGFAGKGVKSVIPASAVGKLSIRLVPDQRPEEVCELLRSRLDEVRLPPGLRYELRVVAAAPPVTMDPRNPAMRAAAAACVRGFGREPVFLRSGGTIPAVHLFSTHLRIPTVLLGFGLRDDRPHGPDEHLHIPTFVRGTRTAIHLLDCLATTLPARRTATRSVRLGGPAHETERQSALAASGAMPWDWTR